MDGSADCRSEGALAFAALDSEVRLAILDSLYDRTVTPGPLVDDATYSMIRADVGIEDSGRFNYHLQRLLDRFITKGEDGYRLSEPGREVVRLRKRGVLTETPTVDASPVDGECYRCGATVEAFYESGYLITRCPDCPGLVDHPLVPTGTLTALAYPPSGVTNVDVETAFERAHVLVDQRVRTMGAGFCPSCGGDVTVTPDATIDRNTTRDGGDATGPYTHDGLVRLSCDHCGRRRVTHPLHAAGERDPMATYLTDHGVEPGWARYAAVMPWPTTVRPDRLVFESPDGGVWTVDHDLGVTRE